MKIDRVILACDDNPLYIEALSDSIKPYLKDYDKIIFSYHGIPERHIKKSDSSRNHCFSNSSCCEIECIESQNCYRSNVLKASKLTAEKLDLSDDKWMTTFPSRVTIIDPKWLKPYTDIELVNFASKGIRNIVILCPSFIADCLETLEEINIRGRKSFLNSGGKKFTFVPCLNNDKNFLSLLKELVIAASK